MKLIKKRDEVFAFTGDFPEMEREIFRGMPYSKEGKPSHFAVHMFDLLKDRLVVGKDDAKKFIAGYDLKTDKEGVAAISYEGLILGKVLCSKGIAKNMIPRAKRAFVEFL